MSKGDTRCLDGRLWRHDPQHDDPDLETDIGKCPDCNGDGCYDCADCGRAATETWSYADAPIPNPPPAEHLCGGCADERRDRAAEKAMEDAP